MDKILEPTDFVGVSFWLISMAMVAATAFFFLERGRVDGKWKTSLTVAGLVTGIAAVHYFYMRDVWVFTGESPTVYRYIDWLLTVPLQIIEFYLILAAIAIVPVAVFWRLLIASIVILKKMRTKLQSFGKVMILMIVKKFPFKSCIRTFVSSPTS